MVEDDSYQIYDFEFELYLINLFNSKILRRELFKLLYVLVIFIVDVSSQ